MLDIHGAACQNWAHRVGCANITAPEFRMNESLKWACEMNGQAHRFARANRQAAAGALDADQDEQGETSQHSTLHPASSPLSSGDPSVPSDMPIPKRCVHPECSHPSEWLRAPQQPRSEDDKRPDLRARQCPSTNSDGRQCQNLFHQACITESSLTKYPWTCSREWNMEHQFGSYMIDISPYLGNHGQSQCCQLVNAVLAIGACFNRALKFRGNRLTVRTHR